MVPRQRADVEAVDPATETEPHPLLAAIARAPLDPISDEENAALDELVRTTSEWMTDEAFVAAVGCGSAP